MRALVQSESTHASHKLLRKEMVYFEDLDKVEAARFWIESAKQRAPPELDKADVGFFDHIVARHVKIERAEKGRVVCSLRVTPGMCVSTFGDMPCAF